MTVAEKYIIQDKEFHENCKKLLIEALKIFKKHGDAGEPIPKIPQGFMGVFLDDNVFSIQLFFDTFQEEIQSLSEFSVCMDHMKKNRMISKHIGNLVGTQERQINYPVAGGYLGYFIINYVSKKGSHEFDEILFENHYNDMETFFYSDVFKLTTLIFLEHFSSECDEIKLNEDIKIIRLPTEELNKIQSLRIVSDFGLSLCTHAIQICSKTEKLIGVAATMVEEPSQSIRKIGGVIVSALRIFKDGLFGFNYIRIDAGAWGPYGRQLYQPNIYKKHFWSRSNYILQKGEITDFLKFLDKFNQLPSGNSFLDVAIRRFNYSYERERVEDKLIDGMIAFESLFLTDHGQEARYKLALRTSFFIAEDPKIRKQILDDMKIAYDLRSRLVHGASQKSIDDMLNKKNTDLPNFTSKINGYLRVSLRAFVEMDNPLKQDDVIEMLETKICS